MCRVAVKLLTITTAFHDAERLSIARPAQYYMTGIDPASVDVERPRAVRQHVRRDGAGQGLAGDDDRLEARFHGSPKPVHHRLVARRAQRESRTIEV